MQEPSISETGQKLPEHKTSPGLQISLPKASSSGLSSSQRPGRPNHAPKNALQGQVDTSQTQDKPPCFDTRSVAFRTHCLVSSRNTHHGTVPWRCLLLGVMQQSMIEESMWPCLRRQEDAHSRKVQRIQPFIASLVTGEANMGHNHFYGHKAT